MGVAEIDITQEVIRFAGVGNVAGVIIYAEGHRSMVSHPGIVGHNLRKIQESSYPWQPSKNGHLPLMVMHSDGLATRWDMERYPGLANRHSSLIAGVLYRDYNRGNDDVTVVAVKKCRQQEGSVEYPHP